MTADELEPLAEAAAAAYHLAPPVSVELLRKGFNHHYWLHTATGRLVLRLYLEGKYYAPDEPHFRFELEMLRHLDARGVPVAAPVARRDGDLLGRIDGRLAAVFTEAPGEPPGERRAAHAAEYGNVIGQLHVAADGFSHPHYTRNRIDGEFLLEQPLRLVRSFLADHGHAFPAQADAAAADLRRRLAELPTDGGAFGFVHGDLHGRNVHLDDAGGAGRFTLFDFDHSGFGWRAYDLATCTWGMSDDELGVFLDGYQRHRLLASAELDALPLFRLLRQVWDPGDVLAMRPVWGVTEQPNDEEWAKRLAEAVTELPEMVAGLERP